MNLKIFFLIITLLALITAELLSYISSCLWDICSNHSPLSESFNRKKLNALYSIVEKIKTVLYVLVIILVIISMAVFFCF